MNKFFLLPQNATQTLLHSAELHFCDSVSLRHLLLLHVQPFNETQQSRYTLF